MGSATRVTHQTAVFLLLMCPLAFGFKDATEKRSGLSADITATLKSAHHKFKEVKDGKNADYIPALAQVSSELFGISLVTPNGQVYSLGDSDRFFSIQSISKVFALAQVLEESGEAVIENSVGVEATGEVFNSIRAIEKSRGHDMNPFVNPGAIATVSQIKGKSSEEIWKKILHFQSSFAGRSLEVDQAVYQSESATNQRNQAIGMLMHAYGHIEKNPQQAVDLYTRQCSISVNVKDLAVMAATLANGGVNPVTKKKLLTSKHAEKVLAVMTTAGMYNDSGKWLFATGLPAKSGVGGGIIAVSPGKFGIAGFSPRLDAAGNSVRAQKAIEYISEKLGGNPYLIEPTQELRTAK